MEIGIDLVNIERMKKIIEKWGERFIKRIFSEEEIEYCFNRKNYVECLGGKFAAKEAVFKILNSPDIGIREIKIIERKVFIKGKKVEDIKISISHDTDYAVSVAIKFP